MPNSPPRKADEGRFAPYRSRVSHRPGTTIPMPAYVVIYRTMTTHRLHVEPLRSVHAPLLFPALADPRIYLYVPDDVHPTVDSLTSRFARLERGAPVESEEVWLNWVLQRMDTSAYIGTLQATVTPDSHAYIGYVLGPPAWGHGFATEIAMPVDRRRHRDMLAAISSRVKTQIKDGRTLADIIAVKPTAEFDEVWGKGLIPPNKFVEMLWKNLPK
jgi:RimJ/RimL family protein N-acetyltransferase